MRKVRKAVFPVAGLATRFLPATKAVPKELLPLVDKPLLQYAVEEAREAGIEEFIFVTSRRKPQIEKHFAPVPELEDWLSNIGRDDIVSIVRDCTLPETALRVVYQDVPRGLGHAVLCAKEHVGDEPFAVILPDDAILARPGVLRQMTDFYEERGGNLLAAMEVPDAQVAMYGIMGGMPDGAHIRISALVEKPASGKAPSNMAIVGRYILQPEIFTHLSAIADAPDSREVQLTDGIARLLAEQAAYGFRFDGQRYDCGHCAGWIEASVAYALERPELKSAVLSRLNALLQAA